jgi:hypothetical protein
MILGSPSFLIESKPNCSTPAFSALATPLDTRFKVDRYVADAT